MSAHTPGPWTARKHTDTKGWTVSAGNSIASVKPRPEAEANARLIAAAPELLEALKEIREACCSGMGSLPAADIKRAQAAIEKAEGR